MPAATSSLALKIAVPATKTLAPAATTNGAVSASMPPSTSIPWFSPCSSCGADFFVFKDVHKLPVAAGDLGHRGLLRDLLGPPVDERIPEVRPAHSEADEPRHCGDAIPRPAYSRFGEPSMPFVWSAVRFAGFWYLSL